METGIINGKNMHLFQEFFSPWIMERIQNGEPVEFIGLTDDETAIGGLAVSFLFGNPEIISIYVVPEYRHKGGGTALVKMAEQIAEDEGMLLTVSFMIPGNEGKDLAAFFEKRGFERVADWPKIYRFSLLELSEALDLVPEKTNISENIVSLSTLTNMQVRNYSTQAYQNGLPTPMGGFNSTTVERDISMISFDGKENMNGYIIIEKNGGSLLSVPAFYQKIIGGKTGIFLMETAFSEAARLYPAKTEVLTYCISPSSNRLLKHLLPKAENESYLYQKLF